MMTTWTTAMTSEKAGRVALVITAAGSSLRMGSEKKEYLPLGGGTVLSESVKQFLKTINICALVITVPKYNVAGAQQALFSDLEIKTLLKDTEPLFVEGGQTRQESVYNALESLSHLTPAPDFVLIHDGARPFVSKQIILDTLYAALEFGAAVPGIQPTDTQKIIDPHGFISEHLNRSSVIAVQTPQGFQFENLIHAHRKAAKDKQDYTDDSEIWGKYVGQVKTVEGSPANVKITYKSDYNSAVTTEKISNLRTGIGYDIHKLVKGRRLVIGGIEIPFDKGESGHSDGDVLLHAITDALLGASGLGDIGSLFPPEDAKWKGANSCDLLKTVWNQVRVKGWKLVNLDCVIKLEQPKFLPFREAVINSITELLEADADQIFVKAKTGEKMDSVGRGSAIEAWCNCLLMK